MYLILTACLENRYSYEPRSERVQRYLFAIQKTLTQTPSYVTPIIVENNGQRSTELDHFQHHGKPVKVIYTIHNQQFHRHKGMNEWLDLQYVIRILHLESEWIIKLTGRYFFISPHFFETVQMINPVKEAVFKFYCVVRKEWTLKECVLGSFAMKGSVILQLNVQRMALFSSSEKAVAAYVNYGTNYEEVKQLDVECYFAEDSQTLLV